MRNSMNEKSHVRGGARQPPLVGYAIEELPILPESFHYLTNQQ
jgi:hypothetical protein